MSGQVGVLRVAGWRFRRRLGPDLGRSFNKQILNHKSSSKTSLENSTQNPHGMWERGQCPSFVLPVASEKGTQPCWYVQLCGRARKPTNLLVSRE